MTSDRLLQSNVPRTAIYAIIIACAALNIFQVGRGGMAIITLLLMALLGCLSFVLTFRLTWKSIAVFSGLVCFLFVSLGMGTNMGFPFGDFAYTRGLGPALVDVPILAPLAWMSLLIPSWVSAGKVLRFRHIVVASIVATAADAVMEFAADSMDLWHWRGGFPTELNYLSWFGISYVAFSIIQRFADEKEPHPIVPHLLYSQLLYFVLSDLGIRFMLHRAGVQ